MYSWKSLQAFTIFTDGSAQVPVTLEKAFVTEWLDQKDLRTQSKVFVEAKKSEIEGLASSQTWSYVKERDLPAGSNIIGGRFVCNIKNVGTIDEGAKIRLIAQGFNDTRKDFIVHNNHTIRQSSIKLIVSTAAVLNLRIASLDFIQAYHRSKEKFGRKIYV